MALNKNMLQQICNEKGIEYVSGSEFYRAQFQNQFKIYTGEDPDMSFYDTIKIDRNP